MGEKWETLGKGGGNACRKDRVIYIPPPSFFVHLFFFLFFCFHCSVVFLLFFVSFFLSEHSRFCNHLCECLGLSVRVLCCSGTPLLICRPSYMHVFALMTAYLTLKVQTKYSLTSKLHPHRESKLPFSYFFLFFFSLPF